jgi:hypothetical protein
MNDQQAPNQIDQLDQLIDHEHGAAVAAENDAMAIERRLRLVSNLPAAWHALPRAHGQVRNPYIKGSPFYSLSARAAVEAADPALASFLARKAGTSTTPIDYAAREREEQRLAAAERMVAETQRLAALNAATRQQHDQARHMNLPNRPGSQGGFYL